MSDAYEPRLYIFSGAGLSAESGIPTFRTGDDALWENHSIEDVCYLPHFMKNYELVHDFYNAMRAKFAGCRPNLGHEQIAKWEQQFGADRVINLTTNIDTLLEDAGCTNVHHIHGRSDELIRNYNVSTGVGTHVDNISNYRVDYELFRRDGEIVKPNVVFFGENKLHSADGVEDLYAHLNKVEASIRPKDVLLIVGASFQVVPVHLRCIGAPFTTINVNPYFDDDEEAVTCAQFFDKQVRDTAGKGLPLLDAQIQSIMNETPIH